MTLCLSGCLMVGNEWLLCLSQRWKSMAPQWFLLWSCSRKTLSHTRQMEVYNCFVCVTYPPQPPPRDSHFSKCFQLIIKKQTSSCVCGRPRSFCFIPLFLLQCCLGTNKKQRKSWSQLACEG